MGRRSKHFSLITLLGLQSKPHSWWWLCSLGKHALRMGSGEAPIAHHPCVTPIGVRLEMQIIQTPFLEVVQLKRDEI